jgi:hypothetical protein
MKKLVLLFCAVAAVAAEPAAAAQPSRSGKSGPITTPSAIASPTPQMRTHVSGAGSDSYPCTASFPCRTLAAALQLTVPGGEIFVLDSADYGAVVINKAITITGEGAVGGILATSGVGITIGAGATDVINLRGLAIDGGNSGTIGIQFNSGQSLNIQKLVVRNFTNSGINFAPNATGALFVSETLVTNNGSNGLLVASGSGAVSAAINRVTASGNGVGIFAFGGNVRLTVADAVTSNNQYGIGASGGAVMVRNSTASNNTIGVAADQSAVVRVGQSTVTANGTGLLTTNGGQIQSYGNNNVSGNTTDGTATNTVALQ